MKNSIRNIGAGLALTGAVLTGVGCSNTDSAPEPKPTTTTTWDVPYKGDVDYEAGQASQAEREINEMAKDGEISLEELGRIADLLKDADAKYNVFAKDVEETAVEALSDSEINPDEPGAN